MTTEYVAPTLGSVCVFCASSPGVDPSYMAGAERLGALLAEHGLRLVYGGGGIGLMGAVARAAHAAGGQVLGVMPVFLSQRELAFEAVETVFVQSMHERKMRMFEESDAFAVLPGGIGTLEEVVELLSWGRLGLHAKPIVFLDTAYWAPLFELMRHTVAQGLTPASFLDSWRAVDRPEDILPAMHAMLTAGTQADPAAALLT